MQSILKKIFIGILVCSILVCNIPTTILNAQSTKNVEIWDGTAATEFAEGEGTAENPYLINTAKELAFLSQLVNEGNSNYNSKCYKLNTDIYLNDISEYDLWKESNDNLNNWSPIGKTNLFYGTFDGSGYSIYGLYIDCETNDTGLFGKVQYATIKNVNLKNCYVKGTVNVGAVIGYTICSVIENCVVNGIIEGTNNVGGVIGEFHNNVGSYNPNQYTYIGTYAKHCAFMGEVGGTSSIGGIIGYVHEESSMYVNLQHVTMESCTNYGVVTASGDNCGGIVGYHDSSFKNLTISGTCNKGEVFGNGINTGGIVGSSKTSDNKEGYNLNIINSYNSGNIIGHKYTGGILGHIEMAWGSRGYISNCYNSGNIVATDNAGGIAGDSYNEVGGGAIFVVCDTYNLGTVEGGNNIGGIVGFFSSGSAERCYNTGKILTNNSSTSIGALMGYNVSTVSNCYYLDTSCEIGGVGTLLTNSQMLSMENYTGFDFESVWGIISAINNGLPYLRIFNDYEINVDKNGFDEYVYRANYLLNDENLGAKGINSILAMQTPCNCLDTAIEESGLDEAIVAWEAIEGLFSTVENPMSLGELVVKPKDMYSALLMNILDSSFSYSLVDNEIEDTAKSTKKFVSSMKNYMEQIYKIDVYDANDFKNLSIEQKDKLSKHASDWFAAEFPALGYTGEVFTGITTAFDTVNSIEDYYNRVVSCMLLYNISEDMKAVLHQAYSDSQMMNNGYLRWALNDCIEIIDASTEELVAKMLMEGVTTAGVNTGKWLFQELLWKDILNKFYVNCPAAAVLMAVYKGVCFGVNTLFSTDKISEQYLQMLATEDIEALLNFTYKNLGEIFLSEPTSENARTYLSALDLMFSARNKDCEQAYKYVDILDEAVVNKMLQAMGAEDNSTEKKSILSVQNAYKKEYDFSTKQWIYNLETDYPGTGLYEYYDALYSRAKTGTITKQITAACPVDVYVYDADGNLVAWSADNVVSCSDENMSVIRVGDEKTFLFYTNQEYKIEYIGSDIGTMDITIEEHNEDAETIRTVKYYDVALEKDIVYEMPVEGDNLADSAYALVEVSDSRNISCNFDSLKENAVYVARLKNGSMIYNNGISWEKEISVGEQVEIHALVPDGKRFVRWESSSNTDIFEDAFSAETSFIMPEENCEITAILEKNELTKIEQIKLNRTEAMLEKGETLQLTTEIYPDNIENKSLIWNVDNNDIVTVKDGLVTALGIGVAVITVEAADGSGVCATCRIEVKEKKQEQGKEQGSVFTGNEDVKVKNIKINAISKKLAAGRKVQLTATVKPLNATEQTLKWTSSNKKYATVDKNGKVKLKKAGAGKRVIITASAIDGSGIKATIKFRIMKHAVKKIKIKTSTKTVKAGKTLTLKTKVTTTGKKVNKKLLWSSSNTKYATVNAKGKVKTKKAGKGKTVTIMVMSTDGTNKKAKLKLRLK